MNLFEWLVVISLAAGWIFEALKARRLKNWTLNGMEAYLNTMKCALNPERSVEEISGYRIAFRDVCHRLGTRVVGDDYWLRDDGYPGDDTRWKPYGKTQHGERYRERHDRRGLLEDMVNDER